MRPYRTRSAHAAYVEAYCRLPPFRDDVKVYVFSGTCKHGGPFWEVSYANTSKYGLRLKYTLRRKSSTVPRRFS